MDNSYDAIALFSGGLDSILSVKVLEEQGLKVKCLHFVSPFFGKTDLIPQWQQNYALDIDAVDISEAFVQMLCARPKHGFGKILNPCIDCKILMLRHARQKMQDYHAQCIISGEVLGQRPMSQRRDTLNVIRHESSLSEILLRPLSALLLKPTAAEISGLVDRTRLHSISGRGRKLQLALAAYYGIKDIPTPAGGCRLAEQENASRYWTVLQRMPHPTAQDFILSQTGRQYWSHNATGIHWLSIGRNIDNNKQLEKVASSQDILFRLRDFTGPLALGRQIVSWDATAINEAACFMASFAPHAVRSGGKVRVHICRGEDVCFKTLAAMEDITNAQGVTELSVLPNRECAMQWREPRWNEVSVEIKQERKDNTFTL